MLILSINCTVSNETQKKLIMREQELKNKRGNLKFPPM